MSDLTKIEEILGQISIGQYIALTKIEDGNFRGHVVTLDPAKLKAVDIDVWTPSDEEPEEKYMGPLCFTAQEDNATVGMVGPNGFDVTASLQTSTDGVNWNTYEGHGWDGRIITLNKGEKLYVKALNPNTDGLYDWSYDGFHEFIIEEGKVAASGNIQYLLDSTGERMDVPAACYYGTFGSRSTSLTQAPELPATTLGDGCYQYMFNGCTSLTQAPELPATALGNGCYYNMFNGCDKLSEVHMKSEMEGVYNQDDHGNTTKTVVYDL